jgi:RNA 2',3'-cyclic 3'-phosphodiesterase
MGDQARHRLFVALQVAQPAHAVLERAVAALRLTSPQLRWANPETWHVTIAFLGGVDEDRLVDVDAAVAQVAGATPALPVRLDGRVDSFGWRVLFASIEENPELEALAGQVADRLRAAGFALEERHFTPHVTLARVPRGTRLPAELLDADAAPAVTWTARELLVMRSRLKVGGAVHEVRGAHRLQPPV